MNKKRIVGYTSGYFDMFHIGHLNLLKNAKEKCDYLVVGVNSDDMSIGTKGKKPIVPEKERLAIIEGIKYVDEVFLHDKHSYGGFYRSGQKIDPKDKDAYYKENADVFLLADDKKDDPEWEFIGARAKKRGAIGVIFFPYTKTTSSTHLRAVLDGEIDRLLEERLG